jgi:hypothetical protein
MLKLSEIITNQNKYLCILNKKTLHLQKFFDNYFIFNDNSLKLILWESVSSFDFLNIQILFLKLKSLRDKEFSNEISLLKKKHSLKFNLISPLPIKNINNFIDNITDEKLPVNLNSENLIEFHRLHCTFKKKNSILLTIFQYFSFNLKDFNYFIISNNYHIKIKNYQNLNKTFNSFFEAVEFLLKDTNQLKINEINIFTEYINTNKYKEKNFNNIYETYTYWQNYFKEEDFSYCQCLYINYKELENYSYLNPKFLKLKPIQYLYSKHKTKIINRRLSIELSDYEIITDYKKFYMEKILKFPSSQNPEEKIHKIKLKSLVINRKIKTFNFNY